MRKQMGKKAIKTALAASVAVSAVATMAPAANASETLNLGPLQEKMVLMNSSFTQKAALTQAVTKIVNDTDGKVTGLVGKYITDGAKQAAAKKLAVGLVQTINGELAKTNSSDVNVSDAVKTFRDNNRTDLEGVFGDLEYTTLVNSVVEILQVLYTEVTFEQVLTQLEPGDTGKRAVMTAAYKAAKNQYIGKGSQNQNNFDVMDSALNNIGLNLESLFELQADLVAAYDDSNKTLQNALFTAAFASLNPSTGGSGSTGGGGGGGGTVTKPTQPGNVGGPVVSAPVTKVETPQGTKVVAKIDESKLTDLISKGEIKDKVAITIEKAKGEIAEAVVSTNAVQALLKNNPNTVIQIATSDATYNLPANEINVQALATSLGVAVGDVEISIQVNTVDAPSNVAGSNLVSPVLEFTIVARSGDKSVTIDKFTTYVERQVEASKDVNSKNVVAVRINADGSLSPVPTITEGNRITFKSNSNSKYTVVENNVTFADIQNSWAKNDIETLANKLIIKGVDANKFAPKAETTRAQVATLLTRSLGLQGQKATKVSFKDVKGNEWFAGDLAVAVNAGIVGGYEDGTFKPNQTITRQEAAAMIKRAMDFAKYDQAALQADKKASSLYIDYTSVGNWAKSDIEVITQAGIMGGDEKGEFNPTNNTTREQLASILKRFMTFVKFTN